MQAGLETIMCKFGGNRAICLREKAILVRALKCPYHMTFDLDLEHNVDAGSPADRRVQVWAQSSNLCARKTILGRAQKCPYHVTFDLDLELTLDAG